MMTILLWVIAGLMILIGLLGTILPALPGTSLVFGGFLLAAWIDDFQKVGWIPLTVLAVLTLMSIGVDFAASSLGAKRLGASRLAIVGAVVGTVAGFFFGFIGILLGPFIGAVIGEYAARRDLIHAGRVGLGTWLGMVLGVAVKIGLVFTMVGIFVTSFIL